jgi:hypothetical protein
LKHDNTKTMRTIRLPFGILACAASLSVQALTRQADWQLALQPDTHGMQVRSLERDSPAARAGLRVGDRVWAIDGMAIGDAPDLFRAQHRSKEGSEVVFSVERNGARLELKFRPRALPHERHEGIDVGYTSARAAPGFHVRLIVTRPAGAGRLPAVIFVPWLSCDPVDYPKGAQDGWSRLLLDLVRESRWVVVRVEKAGVGDSDGPSCVDADLDADLAGFRAAIKTVAQMPDVDPDRVFLFGGSIGATLVPILAAEIPLRGIVATGGTYKTWLEHMLELERRRLVLSGRAPGEVNDALRAYADFHSMYLNGGATPGEVIAKRPDLAALWEDGPMHQYGRPARYFHQLQALNVARAWEAVDVSVLVVYGEFDWIMSREDQELIVATVNRKRPGRARLVVVPQMGHNIEAFPSMATAFEERGGEYTRAVVEEVLQWLRDVAK